MSSTESVFPPNAPVSRALEQELRRELASGLQVWLDKEQRYTVFTDRLHEVALSGEFPPVVGYRGSFLRMMDELEGTTAGARQSPPLLIHMPGFNEDEVRATPVLAYYHAGKRYRRKLETLIENAAAGLIDPDDIRDYVQSNVTTLEAADLWLADQIGSQGDPLKYLALHEIWERLHDGKGEELGDDPERVMIHLRNRVAMDKRWLEETGLESLFRKTDADPAMVHKRQFRILGEILLSWAMAVEYVHDLKREPRTPALAGLPALNKAYVDACRALAQHVRGTPKHEPAYVRVASDFALKLHEEEEGATAEDLGDIDTFLFEDDRILAESLERLIDGTAESVLAWAERRRAEDSIWLRRDPRRSHVWTLIRAAARLDAILRNLPTPLSGVYTLDEAVSRYRTELWEVDHQHRLLEQQRHRLVESQMPHFGQVKAMCVALRGRYHVWSDRCAEAFAKLCAKDGFLPSKELQQREIFESAVRLNVKEGVDRLVYVLLDGFRYEMAQELVDRLGGTNVKVNLQARLAELPSITSVGMNVLAPVVKSGRLKPVVKESGSTRKLAGFESGTGFRVDSPEKRRKAMSDRVSGTNCPLLSLQDVLDSTSLSNALQGTGLAVVHALDIDEAGEVGQGIAAFDTILMQVASAIRQLHDSGVQRFVITADHGFLLEPPQDTIDANGAPGARYRFDPHGQTGGDVVSVALADLGYDGTSLHAVFPRTTRSFSVKGGARNYVHGGNTLQERVIPLLTLDFRNRRGGTRDHFNLDVRRPNDSKSHIRVALRRAQQALDFASGSEEVELTITAQTGASVEIITVGPDAEIAGDSSFYAKPGADYDVDFVVRGGVDGRTAVSVTAKGRADQIPTVLIDTLFDVIGTGPTASDAASSTTETIVESHWSAIEDEGSRKVLQHVDKHGSITESEATQMLGGSRQYRQFSRRIGELQHFLSFGVRAESSSAGKRYVKEK